MGQIQDRCRRFVMSAGTADTRRCRMEEPLLSLAPSTRVHEECYRYDSTARTHLSALLEWEDDAGDQVRSPATPGARKKSPQLARGSRWSGADATALH